MPGIVIFSRRWSVGSDDFIIPAVVLLTVHCIWLFILSLALIIVDQREWRIKCMLDLHEHSVGYIVILLGCIIVEACIAVVSMKGSILNTAPRSSMPHLLYVRFGLFLVEIVWLICGVIWIRRHYDTCTPGFAKEAVLGITICNWCVVASVLLTTWCTFDAAGRSWVKMKRYQNSLRDGQSKYRYRRSGNSHRNWRHRCGAMSRGCAVCMCRLPGMTTIWKAMRAYQDSWNRRCKLLFCCVGKSDRHQNSFSEIAKLLSEFFRDLDVVPSDVIAGLIVLRKIQRIHRHLIVTEKTNDTHQFLSGVAITPKTKFLDVTHSTIVDDIKTLIHYLHYAVAVYGWPMFMMTNSATGCCQLCPFLRCSRCAKRFGFKCCSGSNTILDSVYPPVIIGDNCCNCNYAALQRICQTHRFEVIYITYHVSIGEPPFLVALDHDKRTIVVSVRGTLSLQDVITDLNAEGDILPTNPKRENWLGHRGMVEAAAYIRKKLTDEKILQKALNCRLEKGTADYNLVLVGHSLGAGTAAILAILLKEDYPELVCYAFSPPGGLLSLPATEYTKEFITSVILGKDVVPRLGLHQMESLRFDLINAIKKTHDPKWKIIGSSIFCCCPSKDDEDEVDAQSVAEVATVEKDLSANPNDTSIAMTVHQPMYPPGRIIHIVRNHPDDEHRKRDVGWRNVVRKNEPVYQALWANNTDFDHIVISPVMVQDHMPDKVLEALEKLLVNTGPPKPQRKEYQRLTCTESNNYTLLPYSGTATPDSFSRTPSHRVVLETSFTDLQPVGLDSDFSSNNTPKKLERPTLLSALRFYRKVDLIHDDWMGTAPLASPETLSEISSISSKSFSTKQAFCNSSNVRHMERIEQSPVSQASQDISSVATLECQSMKVDEIDEDNFEKFRPEVETALDFDVLAMFRTLSTTSENMEEDDANSDEEENESVDKKNLLKNKRVTFNLRSPNLERNNRDDFEHSLSASDGNLVHSSSDLDLNCAWNEPLPPLRRSYEKINLSDLDDSVPIFDSTSAQTKASTSIHSTDYEDNEMSPTSQLLFQKLLTIESPSDETPTCDAFNITSFEVSESNL